MPSRLGTSKADTVYNTVVMDLWLCRKDTSEFARELTNECRITRNVLPDIN